MIKTIFRHIKLVFIRISHPKVRLYQNIFPYTKAFEKKISARFKISFKQKKMKFSLYKPIENIVVIVTLQITTRLSS